jgi:hypothetical protein
VQMCVAARRKQGEALRSLQGRLGRRSPLRPGAREACEVRRLSSSLFFGQTFQHFVTRFDSWIPEYAIEIIVDSGFLRRKCRRCGVT